MLGNHAAEKPDFVVESPARKIDFRLVNPRIQIASKSDGVKERCRSPILTWASCHSLLPTRYSSTLTNGLNKGSWDRPCPYSFGVHLHPPSPEYVYLLEIKFKTWRIRCNKNFGAVLNEFPTNWAASWIKKHYNALLFQVEIKTFWSIEIKDVRRRQKFKWFFALIGKIYIVYGQNHATLMLAIQNRPAVGQNSDYSR